MIRNLGQVAAIYIGSSAPRNTNLIWLDNTVVPFVFRAYDGSAWSEIATHKWVRAYVDGWLVTLPPRQLADDGDYMLINSNNVNYKITVKDFVKSAVGNPLDFKGVIRVSADFPNPSTLEAGDMYVIITSPVGGTVTDPYSGKTFEDSEKIVWDEVTRSWESLGKINITVNLTTSYSETEVTIHSSAGKETTIQGVTDQLAGVMLPGQYSWLQALSNGSIVPGDPSSLTPLTPAHKHNYGDIINRLVSQQETGTSTIDPMSQKATTDALNLKFDKASVLQVSGAATDKVMSQKAVTDALKTLRDDFDNKLTNYLPLAGGTMKGSIRFPIGNGIACNDVAGTAAYVVLRTWNANNSTRMYVGAVNFPTYISSTASDLIHDRNGSSYLLWDSYNLPTPASTTDLANYLPLIGGTLTGQLTIKQEANIKLRLQSTDADNHCIIQAINSQASQLGVFGYAGDKWVIGHNGTYYEIWDKYNLTNPVKYTTNVYNYATLTNKDGQYFTYIKAGTNGLLPHSQATLANGGAGLLGTSDWSFSAAYINNLYTNRIMFSNNTWTNDLTPNRNYNGYLQVLDAYDAANAGGPTNYGTVLQVNSRNAHWANQLWFSGGVEASKNGLYYRHMPYNSTTYGEWIKLATTSDLGNYLPLSGGTLPGNLTINTVGSPTFVINNNDTNGSETFMRVLRKGNASAAIGFRDSLGAYIYNYNSNKYLFIDNDGYVKVGTTSGSTRLALITDIPTVSGYLPLSGGTLTGALTMNSRKNNAVIDVVGGTGNNWNGGAGALSVQVPSDNGQTPLILARRSGATINTTTLSERLLDMALLDTGTIFRVGMSGVNALELEVTSFTNKVGIGKLFGKQIATENFVTSQNYYKKDSSNPVFTSGLLIDAKGLNSSWAREYVIGNAGAASSYIRYGGFGTNNTPTYAYIGIGSIDYNSPNTLKVYTDKVTFNNKNLATTDQIPSIPSISISNSGSGNAVTAISASGHTLTVTKGATYLTSSSLDGYATQTWANGQFASLSLYNTTGSYTTIRTRGNEFCLGNTIATSASNEVIVNYRIPSGCTYAPSTWVWRAGSSTSYANGYWGSLYMNDNLVATQSWVNNKGYLTSHQTIYNLTFQAGTFSAKTFDPNGAAATVNIPTNTSHLTNDSGFITNSALNGYVTQAWVNSQNFVKSTSTKKVTDIQPVDALPATQASGVLYLVFG